MDGKSVVHVVVRGSAKTMTRNIVDAENHAIEAGYRIAWNERAKTQREGIARPKSESFDLGSGRRDEHRCQGRHVDEVEHLGPLPFEVAREVEGRRVPPRNEVADGRLAGREAMVLDDRPLDRVRVGFRESCPPLPRRALRGALPRLRTRCRRRVAVSPTMTKKLLSTPLEGGAILEHLRALA